MPSDFLETPPVQPFVVNVPDYTLLLEEIKAMMEVNFTNTDYFYLSVLFLLSMAVGVVMFSE